MNKLQQLVVIPAAVIAVGTIVVNLVIIEQTLLGQVQAYVGIGGVADNVASVALTPDSLATASGYNSATDALQTASGTWSVQASNYDDVQGSGYSVQGSGVEIQ